MDKCTYEKIGCPFEGTEDSLAKHMITNTNEHLKYAIEELERHQDRIYTCESALKEQQSQTAEKQELLSQQQTIAKQQQKIEELEDALDSIQKALKNYRAENTIAQTQLESQINKLCDIIPTCPNTWIINDFAKNFQFSKQENNEILSEPFYCLNGYRGQLGVYLNGYGDKQNTHISISFYICKGPFDEILDWPFKGIVKMSVKAIHCKDDDIVFKLIINRGIQKPTTGKMFGIGDKSFILHSILPSGFFYPSMYSSNPSFIDMFVDDDTFNLTVDVTKEV